MESSDLRGLASWLGKRSYEARVKRLGLERIQQIARENGKKGGRPKGTGKNQLANQETAKKGGK
jgi:galactokinase/mevalonate kinase-like predicted kinase